MLWYLVKHKSNCALTFSVFSIIFYPLVFLSLLW